MSYEHCDKHDCDATNGCEPCMAEGEKWRQVAERIRRAANSIRWRGRVSVGRPWVGIHIDPATMRWRTREPGDVGVLVLLLDGGAAVRTDMASEVARLLGVPAASLVDLAVGLSQTANIIAPHDLEAYDVGKKLRAALGDECDGTPTTTRSE